MVGEDNDATLGMVWVLVAVAFEYQAGHGWDGAGCVAFASEAMILFLDYHSINEVIEKALFLFLVDL